MPSNSQIADCSNKTRTARSAVRCTLQRVYLRFRMKMDGEIAQAGGDTIFGKIIRGEIQTPFLYEDDQVFTYRLHAKYSELDHRD